MQTISTRWLTVTLTAVLVTQGGVAVVRALYEPRHIRAPRDSVRNLPVTLGDWHASADDAGRSGMKQELMDAVWADDTVTRFYTHTNNQECSVHLAVWHASDEWMPHPPYMCYPAAGFVSFQNQAIDLHGVDYGPVMSTRYMNSATGQSVTILYWYQMGNRHYVDRDSARQVRRSFWGNRERPPLVKVLLQIPNRDRPADLSTMCELASDIHRFVREL